ncbi:hypothetical protein [Pseudomonas aeruginosa]|uniref:hypothetical protein n=1 Tax=Pseudomonas aeruginosa TaxID=287 RepID=UPI00067D6157|nr:hypothetical protein [Pseudomonas aeruginosa]
MSPASASIRQRLLALGEPCAAQPAADWQGDIALPVGGGLRRARLAKRQQALANARGSRAHPQAPRCQSA